ncbi:hypothetical protein AWL63_18990 [Sphingomonas panacis]|uniref:Uncharacterized protein n=1 Tax=Sphingomonas panacis TaxID=1560345 RepID=A0A1B3ZE54_9SPHN|nr:hypothetical protein [Sphingomonas panacis]AOH85716.1 hypothetical protein AWL63_18990 [Sphingomonas panacis]
MRDLDYTGSSGGLLALAFGAGWATATTMWFAVAGMVWRFFLEPQIAQLKADNLANREQIMRLETALLIHGSASVKRAIQATAPEPAADEAATP